MGTAVTLRTALAVTGFLALLAGGVAAAEAEISGTSGHATHAIRSDSDRAGEDQVAQLRGEIDELRQVIAVLRARLDSVTSYSDQEHVTELIAEVAVLRAELDALGTSSVLEHQTADLGTIGYPPTASADDVNVPSRDDHRIEVSGFFDVLGTYRQADNDHTRFDLGQAEIDLSASLSPTVGVLVSPAYDEAQDAIEICGAEADIALMSNRTGLLTSVGLVAGLFDVPFGIDYQCYCSVDRKLITTPRVVLATHGCWSDYGARLDLTSPLGNLTAYAVNGFTASSEILDNETSLETGIDTYDTVDTSPANAAGGRLGVTPHSAIEIGGSMAVGFNRSDRTEMILAGTDIRAVYANLELTGEYIFHSLNRSVGQRDNRGYYIQGLYTQGRAFAVTRYDAFRADRRAWDRSISVGCGYEVVEGMEIRLETAFGEHAEDDESHVQLAVTI